MAASPAPPETEREIKLDDIPVAQPELEPPYRVLVHNDTVTFPLCSNSRIFRVVAPARASRSRQSQAD